MGDKSVIIRTIDVGGDKQLDYLPLPAEANPVLGLRGIRLAQVRPEMLDQQLRALLQVSPLRVAGSCCRWSPKSMNCCRSASASMRCAPNWAQPAPGNRRDDRSPRRRAAWPNNWPNMPTSCRSAPTTCPSTPWPWTATTPASPHGSMRCTRRCCG
jgi:hypothetical protein